MLVFFIIFYCIKYNKYMNFLISFIEIFLFVFACLVIVKNIYSVIKVMKLKEGKVDSSLFSEITLGSAISYIITMLIIGF